MRFQPQKRTIFDLDIKDVNIEPVIDRSTGEPMEGKYNLCVTYNSAYWKAPYTQRYAGAVKENDEYDFNKNSESFRFIQQISKLGIDNPFDLMGKKGRFDKIKINRFSRTQKWFPISIEKE